MQNNNPLNQLKDIYLPDNTISQWWPLAYGWWIVIIATTLVILILIFLLFILYRKKKYRLYKKSVINDFRDSLRFTFENDPSQILQSVSVFLKRVALQKFPKEDISALYGKDWLVFLDSKMKNKEFNQSPVNLLANSYKPQILQISDLEQIVKISEKWLWRVL